MTAPSHNQPAIRTTGWNVTTAVNPGVADRVAIVGQQRMTALHGGAATRDLRALEIYPNLWAGIGLVRGGAGTALVGSHTEVADRIAEYHALGIEEFILSGYPHLEEAYWFAEGVRPELSRRGLLTDRPSDRAPQPVGR